MSRRDRQHTSFIRRLLGLRVVLVVNVVLLILLSLSFGREFIRNYNIQKDVAALEQEAESLQVRNLRISELRTQMQTESFIEKEARLKLGLKKEGERVIVVQDGNDPQANNQGATAASTDELLQEVSPANERESSEQTSVSNAKKWWYYFFDRQLFEEITYESRE